MAYAVADSLRAAFPLTSGKHTLELTHVAVDAAPGHDDWNGQKDAALGGKTWGAAIRATFALKDEHGKLMDQKAMSVGLMPTITNRHTFIVNGKEYSVANQRRLRPGIYTKTNRLGEAIADFNLKKGRNFSVTLDPAESLFHLKVGSALVPLDTVSKAVFGHAKLDMPGFEHDFTPEEELAHLKTLHAALSPPDTATPSDRETLVHGIRERMSASLMDGEINQMTLGKSHTSVTREALLDAADRVKRIHARELEPTGKEQMAYTEVHGIEDFVAEKIRRGAGLIKHKIRTKLDRAEKIADLPLAGAVGPLVHGFFAGSNLANTTSQINPLEMAEHAYKLTSMGEGGIGDTNAIPNEIRAVHPSQMGFIDPVRTPDNFKAGVDIRTAIGVKKIGRQLFQPVVDARSGKTVMKSPVDLYDRVVAHDKETPDVNGFVRAVHRGQYVDAKPSEIDFHVNTERQFTVSTAIVPFVPNSHAHRVAMGAKMLGQALSLEERESPIVDTTYSEEAMKGILPTSPVAGTVSRIDPGVVTIRSADGTLHKVPYPHDFPLNGGSFLHTTLAVHLNDHVAKGQLLGDNNFTQGGKMALGKNMTVAFVPFKGHNYEDGITVTETGAAKLTSSHQFVHDVDKDPRNVHHLAKWAAHFPGVFDTRQLSQLDVDGVIKEGTMLAEGQPIMAIMRQKVQNPEQLLLGKAHKGLMQPYRDTSITWDKPYAGRVMSVRKTGSGVKVTIAAKAPAVVGDKLCYDGETEILTRRGWKPVTEVTVNDELASLDNCHRIEYIKPVKAVAYHHQGKMYHVETTQVSLMVTPDHALYVKPRSIKADNSFRLTPASEMAGKRYAMKKNGDWNGESPPFFVIPACTVKAGQGGVGVRDLLGHVFPVQTYLMVLGMFLSEGNLVDQPKFGSYGFDITQIKEPHRSEMIAALGESGIRYGIHSNDTKIRVYSKAWMEHLKPLGKSFEKYIPDEVFECAKEDLNILYRWLMWGDGHTQKSGTDYYTTTSERLAGDMQRLALHLGWSATVKRRPGSPVGIEGRKGAVRDRFDVSIIKHKNEPTINHGHAKTQSGQAEEWVDFDGMVYCVTLPKNHTLYVRRKGKTVWSGNCGRFGNKGVITQILPDHLAPHTADGTIPDILLNSAGLNSRMNNGQIYEVCAAKALLKMGVKSRKFEQFGHGNTHAMVTDLVAKSGTHESEEMFDGATGQSIGKTLIGPMYFLKLFKTVDTGYSARSGGTYDVDMRPAKGGEEGAKSIGTLDLAALLSHGAKHILRESATTKAEYSPEAFHALWAGLPIPPPKPTFAYQKFLAMVEGAGVNVHKEGSKLTLLPLTDKDILAHSNGLITKAITVNDKKDPVTGLPFRPEAHGLFDPHVTGGLVGTKWGHITMSEPTINPVFANPARMLLGLSKAEFAATLAKEGGEGMAARLKAIDPSTHIASLTAKLGETNNPGARDVLHKQLRYLSALKKHGLTPDAAYVLHHVPVVPPGYRPIYPDAQTGAIVNSDANRLYQNLILISDQLADHKADGDPESVGKLRTGLHEALAAVQGLDGNAEKVVSKDEPAKGFLKIIAGTTSAKEGFFQSKLISRRQDVAGRGVAVPDPTLGIDQIGLPLAMCWKLFRNHAVGELVRGGMPLDAAATHIKDQTDTAHRALLEAMRKVPALLSRAPSLHKFSIQAFHALPMAGKSVVVNNLIHKGLNLDHDGDAVNIHVPLGHEAIAEAHRLMPSKNLFNPLNNAPVNTPTNETTMGLWKITHMAPGTRAIKTFATHAEAIAAYGRGEIRVDDAIEVTE